MRGEMLLLLHCVLARASSCAALRSICGEYHSSRSALRAVRQHHEAATPQEWQQHRRPQPSEDRQQQQQQQLELEQLKQR